MQFSNRNEYFGDLLSSFTSGKPFVSIVFHLKKKQRKNEKKISLNYANSGQWENRFIVALHFSFISFVEEVIV